MPCTSAQLLLAASLLAGAMSQEPTTLASLSWTDGNNREVAEEGGTTGAPVPKVSEGAPIACVCEGSFLAGQTVRLVHDADGLSSRGPQVGATGVVRAGASLSDPPLLVEWDGLGQGHDGNCQYTTCGNCVTRGSSYWYVFCEDVVPTSSPTTISTTTTTNMPSQDFEVYCLETSMSVRLPPAARNLRILGSESLPACQPQIDEAGGVLFDVGFEGVCNVTRHHNGSHFVHTMTVMPVYGDIVPLDVPARHTIYTCRCVAPAVGTVDVSIRMPQDPDELGQEKESPFEPQLRVHASDSFNNPLEPGDDLPADAGGIYLQVVSSMMADIIGWVNCTASPTASDDDPFSVPLLTDSCPVNPLNPLPAVVENASHIRRLTVPLFKFAGIPQAYFKCWVARCPASAPQCSECDSEPFRLLGEAASASDSQEATAAAGTWLRLPETAEILPGPVSAELGRVVWESPLTEAPPLGSIASNITLLGCDADPAQTGFHEAVAAAIAQHFGLKEADVKVTRVVAMAHEDLRRRLSGGAIVVEYVLLVRPATAQEVDAGTFVVALHQQLSARGLGSALGSAAIFAPVAQLEPPTDEEPDREAEDQAISVGLLVGAILGGGTCLAAISGALSCRWRRQRQEAAKQATKQSEKQPEKQPEMQPEMQTDMYPAM